MLNQDRASTAVEISAWAGRRSKVLKALADKGTLKCIPACKRILRVLVADSDRDTADSLSLLVKIWGHGVWTVYDGIVAVEAAFVYQPDVLLLDIAMPRMDGCEVVRHLRRQPRFEDSLLIAVTGWADETHRQLGEAAGFDLYLVKPAEPLVLEVLLAYERARLANTPETFLVSHNVRQQSAANQDRRGRHQALMLRNLHTRITPSHGEGLYYDRSRRDES